MVVVIFFPLSLITVVRPISLSEKVLTMSLFNQVLANAGGTAVAPEAAIDEPSVTEADA